MGFVRTRGIKCEARFFTNPAKLVPPPGLEPGTLCLEGRCSIQMSYGGTCGILTESKIFERFGQEGIVVPRTVLQAGFRAADHLALAKMDILYYIKIVPPLPTLF